MSKQPIPIRRNPGEEEHERAIAHRAHALDALACLGEFDDVAKVNATAVTYALVHALLAVEARIEELTVYIARQ